MKRFWIAALLALSVSVAHADYSEGYRMGMLEKYSVSGMLTKSGEGFLNLGREGTPVIETDKKGNKKYINPWAFSASSDRLSKFNQNYMNQFAGQYVVIKYRQDFFNTGISQKTDYNIESIDAVNPMQNKPMTCEDPTAKGVKSDGFRVGRLVKASTKGTLNKTYEVTMQVGNSGNLYFPMSALSKEMYDCVIANLKSAKQVKVFYAKSWVNFIQDTNYSIAKIEPVGDI
jgi:hypothetical protein